MEGTRRERAIVRKVRRGFTLIEIMVVIAIAVLAAMLVNNFLHARNSSQTSACEANEKQIATALEQYAVDHGGVYPPAGPVVPAMFGGANNPYLTTRQTDPVSGKTYTLLSSVPDCPDAAYEITDQGGHDPVTTAGLPGAAAGAQTIYFCQNNGFSAK